jgi:zinc transport system substrate-binding protein
VVESASSFRSKWIESADKTTHSHGLAGEHTHTGTAFTTWIDPTLAIEQVATIRDALIKARPAATSAFEANANGLIRELLSLDGQLESAFAGQASNPILFSHPVYGYLIRRYGLDGHSVHWEPGETPSDEDFAELAEFLKEHPAKWMIWEGEPNEATRGRLRELGVECVVFAPGGNLGPATGTWLEVQRANATALGKALQ